MTWFWWLIAAAIVVLWIAALVDIVRRRKERSAGRTILWIVAVLVFPVLGTLLYFGLNARPAPGARDAAFDYEKHVADRIEQQQQFRG